MWIVIFVVFIWVVIKGLVFVLYVFGLIMKGVLFVVVGWL